MYSKKYLDSVLNGLESEDDMQKVANNLYNLMLEGGKISLAEEKFLGIIIYAETDDDGKHPNMHDYSALKNDLFRRLYPLYVRNRDGLLKQNGVHGEISLAERMQDIEFLEKEYKDWSEVIANGKYNRASLQHLQKIHDFAMQAQLGSKLRNAMLKEITLHSKFLLMVVDEYYQELGASEQKVYFAGGEIVVDSYGYVHTLFRHYAQHIKNYQINKTYHFNLFFDYEDIPNVIVDILTSYFRNLPDEGINDNRIFVKINGVLYALWFIKMSRTVKGGVKEVYYRFQTCYPVLLRKI
jgi:hypothetical protein